MKEQICTLDWGLLASDLTNPELIRSIELQARWETEAEILEAMFGENIGDQRALTEYLKELQVEK